MKAALNQGPVAVAVDASNQFESYKRGILNNCKGTHLNHAIAAVGYGSEGGKEYWIVRNSWSTRWGEKGYIRMAVGEGNG